MSAAELISTHGGFSPSDESGPSEMFPGIVGDLVSMAEAHTEASAAAIAAQFIVMFGNAVGHGPYFPVGETRHYLNENLLVVGSSAVARKGDGYHVARAPFKTGEPEWEKSRIKGGLATGEGLIHHVRDRRMRVDKKGVEEIVDEGVLDKRLMIVESEFANLLKVAARDGNTLTGVVRQAWDGNETLSNLSKGSAEQASGSHVSIIGHSTPEDLTQYLSTTDAANGFGNRFLMIATKRARLLPNPTSLPSESLTALGLHLRTLIDQARRAGKIRRSPEAAELWADVYGELSTPPPGLLGALLARSAPHVARLSMAYALLDGSTKKIEARHVVSALAFWQVVAESTRQIFMGRTGNRDAQKIREHMEPGDELAMDQIRQTLFSGKIPGERLRAACHLLTQVDEFEMGLERKTGGRPREVLIRLTSVQDRKRRRENGGVEPGDDPHTFPPFPPFPA